MKIEEVALTFDFDVDSLENWLSRIKDQYEKQQEGHNSYLNKTEVNALINSTGKRAKKLADNLNSLPIDVKEALSGVCIYANLPVKEDNSNPTSNSEDFIDDTISRLKKIEGATSKLTLNFGQKKMFHRDWLLGELRASWEDLAGSAPSKSSGKNPFIDYMEISCEFMGIDSKGLRRKHLNTDLPVTQFT